tara:strand:- start:12949 stop:13215 length:267 start_codon:yes stop_codon:yes gene_type:complete
LIEILSVILNEEFRPFIIGKILEVGFFCLLLITLIFLILKKKLSDTLRAILYIFLIFLILSMFINIINDLLFLIKQFDLIERFFKENN